MTMLKKPKLVHLQCSESFKAHWLLSVKNTELSRNMAHDTLTRMLIYFILC